MDKNRISALLGATLCNFSKSQFCLTLVLFELCMSKKSKLQYCAISYILEIIILFVFNAHQSPVAQEVLSTGADSIIIHLLQRIWFWESKPGRAFFSRNKIYFIQVWSGRIPSH